MRRHLLLAATLGALAVGEAPAEAHGPDLAHRNVGSSFGLSIILGDGPKVVGHDHHGRHLRPQPWPRRFGHAPFARWHQPGHRQMQRFRFHDGGRHMFRFHDGDRHGFRFRNDRRHGFFTPGPRHGQRGWMGGPWGHDRRVFNHDGPDGRFMDGPRRSQRDRHRDR
jgi:hypothetical protein